MKSQLTKISFLVLFSSFCLSQAQFRNKDRMDRSEGIDNNPYSWGFYLALSQYDFKLNPDKNLGMENGSPLIYSNASLGFGAGLIIRKRLDEYFDIRMEPGLQFVQRDLTFLSAARLPQYITASSVASQDLITNRVVKSTYIDIPFMLEVHGNRWHNSRPFFSGGFNYLVNLQSNQNSTDDNQQGVFRTTSQNFGWSAELGVQFYFSRFKLTPAFRGTFFFNNELVKDNVGTPPVWAGALNTINSRAFLFVLKFE